MWINILMLFIIRWDLSAKWGARERIIYKKLQKSIEVFYRVLSAKGRKGGRKENISNRLRERNLLVNIAQKFRSESGFGHSWIQQMDNVIRDWLLSVTSASPCLGRILRQALLSGGRWLLEALGWQVLREQQRVLPFQKWQPCSSQALTGACAVSAITLIRGAQRCDWPGRSQARIPGGRGRVSAASPCGLRAGKRRFPKGKSSCCNQKERREEGGREGGREKWLSRKEAREGGRRGPQMPTLLFWLLSFHEYCFSHIFHF